MTPLVCTLSTTTTGFPVLCSKPADWRALLWSSKNTCRVLRSLFRVSVYGPLTFKRRSTKGVRYFFFMFGHFSNASVTFSSHCCQTPFAGPLLRQSDTCPQKHQGWDSSQEKFPKDWCHAVSYLAAQNRESRIARFQESRAWNCQNVCSEKHNIEWNRSKVESWKIDSELLI